MAGVATGSIPYGSTMAMTHPTKRTARPDYAEVIPTLTRYEDTSTPRKPLLIEISNLGQFPIHIQPYSLLCEIQQVEPIDPKQYPSLARQSKLGQQAMAKLCARVGTEDDGRKRLLGQFKLDEDLTQEQQDRHPRFTRAK